MAALICTAGLVEKSDCQKRPNKYVVLLSSRKVQRKVQRGKLDDRMIAFIAAHPN